MILKKNDMPKIIYFIICFFFIICSENLFANDIDLFNKFDTLLISSSFEYPQNLISEDNKYIDKKSNLLFERVFSSKDKTFFPTNIAIYSGKAFLDDTKICELKNFADEHIKEMKQKQQLFDENLNEIKNKIQTSKDEIQKQYLEYSYKDMVIESQRIPSLSNPTMDYFYIDTGVMCLAMMWGFGPGGTGYNAFFTTIDKKYDICVLINFPADPPWVKYNDITKAYNETILRKPIPTLKKAVIKIYEKIFK